MTLEFNPHYRNRLARKKPFSKKPKTKTQDSAYISFKSPCSIGPFLNDEISKKSLKSFLRQNNKNLENALYIGIDESFIPPTSHGEPRRAVFAAVFSQLKEDLEYKEFIIKTRPNTSSSILNILEKRNYSYLICPNKHCQQENFLGNLLGSLIKDEIPKNISHLEFFIDGINYCSGEERALNILSGISKIKKENIFIISEPKLDEQLRIVNYADLLAYRIFREHFLNFQELQRNIYCPRVFHKDKKPANLIMFE